MIYAFDNARNSRSENDCFCDILWVLPLYYRLSVVVRGFLLETLTLFRPG